MKEVFNLNGSKMKKLRKKKNLTQGQLASLINLTHASISGYETGARSPDIQALTRIADILDTSTDYLLDRTEIPSVMNKNPEILDLSDLSKEDVKYIKKFYEALSD